MSLKLPRVLEEYLVRVSAHDASHALHVLFCYFVLGLQQDVQVLGERVALLVGGEGHNAQDRVDHVVH